MVNKLYVICFELEIETSEVLCSGSIGPQLFIDTQVLFYCHVYVAVISYTSFKIYHGIQEKKPNKAE